MKCSCTTARPSATSSWGTATYPKANTTEWEWEDPMLQNVITIFGHCGHHSLPSHWQSLPQYWRNWLRDHYCPYTPQKYSWTVFSKHIAPSENTFSMTSIYNNCANSRNMLEVSGSVPTAQELGSCMKQRNPQSTSTEIHFQMLCSVYKEEHPTERPNVQR